MKRFRSILSLLFAALLLATSPVTIAAAEDDELYAVELLSSAGDSLGFARAYDGSYVGNTYLSLTDVAAALKNTEKRFRFEHIVSSADGDYGAVTLDASPVLAAGATSAIPRRLTASLYPYRNRLFVNGADRRYYTHRTPDGDLYMSLTDLQLMLDLTIRRSADRLFFETETPFMPELWELLNDGYFDMMDSVLLGDTATGELFFYLNSDESLPVASISKLLSYLVLKEAIDAGEIREDDAVTISANAEALSHSGDGIIRLTAGKQVPLRELTEAMLVASSNECILALAEHLCGREELFTARMNTRAAELGLDSVRVYNCSGLPSYTPGGVPSKRQNCMSAVDLFRLTQYLLVRYPEILEITSKQFAAFPSLENYQTANSNPLLFNVPGVNGLKTGSTNRAGYCLVGTMPMERNGETHTIVVIVLGAEGGDVRGQAAEILLRCAKNY